MKFSEIIATALELPIIGLLSLLSTIATPISLIADIIKNIRNIENFKKSKESNLYIHNETDNYTQKKYKFDFKRTSLVLIISLILVGISLLFAVAEINKNTKNNPVDIPNEQIITTDDSLSESISISESIKESISNNIKNSLLAEESSRKESEAVSLSEAEKQALEEKNEQIRNEYLSSNAYKILKDQENINTNLSEKTKILENYAGYLESDGDINEYTIVLESNCPVWIEFNHQNLTYDRTGWKIEIFDNNNSELCEFTSNWSKPQTNSPKIGLQKGVYTVKVSSSGYFSDADYSLFVYYVDEIYYETESNDEVLGSTPILLNGNGGVSTVYGNLTASDDCDFYKFEMQNDGHVSLKFEHSNLTNDDDAWEIEIWDVESDVVYSFKSNLNKIYTYSPNLGLSKGIYYIKVVSCWTHRSSVYAISLGYQYNDFWENEYNDSITYSKKIYSGSTYYGTITNDDVDYYSFLCADTGTYTFTFSHDVMTNESVAWKIEILNEQSEMIIEDVFKSKWNDDKISITIELEKGICYHFKIYGDYSYSTKDYSLLLSKHY